MIFPSLYRMAMIKQVCQEHRYSFYIVEVRHYRYYGDRPVFKKFIYAYEIVQYAELAPGYAKFREKARYRDDVMSEDALPATPDEFVKAKRKLEIADVPARLLYWQMSHKTN